MLRALATTISQSVRGSATSRVSNVALCALMLLLSACVSIRPVFVDQKTELENQILGTFQEIDKDLILISSVRDNHHAAQLSEAQKKLYNAVMNREFRCDDIRQLKTDQIVGEAYDGALKPNPQRTSVDASTTALLDAENRDRKVIIGFVSQKQGTQRPIVARMFHQIQLEEARPGDLVQSKAGQWSALTAP